MPLGDYQQVYVRNMIGALRGYPMYNPTPDSHYPLQIRRKGFLIGDVCFAAENGLLMPLFNIYQPASYGLNVRGVPTSFIPLKLHPGNVTKRTFNASASVAGPSVRVVRTEDCGLQ